MRSVCLFVCLSVCLSPCCLSLQDLKECVQLSRVRDHFICECRCNTTSPNFTSPVHLTHTVSVESTGALSADTLVVEALKILIDKCTAFITAIDGMTY